MSLGSHYSPPLKRLQCAHFDVGHPLNYDLSTTCFLGSAVVGLLVGYNAVGCNAADSNAVDHNAADCIAADFHSTWCFDSDLVLCIGSDFSVCLPFDFFDISVCSDFSLM